MTRATASPLASYAISAAELKERQDAERAGLAFVAYLDGDGRQRIVVLDPARRHLTIGRMDGNDISLAWDQEVSRVHAELELVGGEWAIGDDGLSRNGTFVNGERVFGRRRLRHGDELRCGQEVLAFRGPGRGDTGSTKVSEAVLPVHLSETQLRVLLALCRPYYAGGRFATPATNRQIATELFLGVDAVKAHLRKLFAKLAIDDLPHTRKRVRLAELALQRGLISERALGISEPSAVA